MAISGVLFDFSGTLMRIEPPPVWLGTVLRRAGISLPAAERDRLAAALDQAGALPGGSLPREVPPPLAGLWRDRDRDAARHRELFTALARQVPLPDPALYDALYDRHMEADAWHPYPDAARVLRELRERGVGVAVVSNIGWDLRPVLAAHGLSDYVDAYALSYEHGMVKPEPGLFAAACEALGVAPGQALMVGDSVPADGGAAALGCAVHFVEPLPVEQRATALLPVLERAG